MNIDNAVRIRKYVLRMSMLFCVLSGGHILYTYIYDEALESPKNGGVITEGVIGQVAHLNPLIDSSDYNKNIISFLYRSLVRYDDTTGEIVGDLADCDLSDLSRIKCVLKNNIFWSDGSPITIDDVRDTYNVIEKSDLNTNFANILKNTTVHAESWEVIFTYPTKTLDLIHILFTPIVNAEVLNSKRDLKMNFDFNDVYSGPYMLDPRESFVSSSQTEQNIDKLILHKNPYYKEKEVLVEKYMYMFFSSPEHMKSHQNLVNIVFDRNRLIGDSNPRFTVYPYFFHQFNTLFLNQARLKNPDLRQFILSRINTSAISSQLGKQYQKVDSIFELLGVESQVKPVEKELGDIMNASGYYKKPQLATILQENPQKKSIETVPLQHIVSPFTVNQFFTSENNILLKGTIGDKNPDAIYFSDYKLSGYKKWDKEFFYRIRTDQQTLHPGKNLFYVHFETGGEKELVDTFTITYSSRPEKLKELEEEYQKEVEASKVPEALQEELLAKLDALDENTYYNKDLQKFTLRLYYNSARDTDIAANMIQTMLEGNGFQVNIFPFSLKELAETIAKPDGKDYDILITWLDTRQFSLHWYAYFHSSQTKEKFHNYTQIQDNQLDILLEEAKEHVLSPERTIEVAQKMQQILDEKYIIQPLYKKQYILLADKNIKNFSFPSNIVQETALIPVITDTYVSAERTIDTSTKTIPDFFRFVKKVFSGNE